MHGAIVLGLSSSPLTVAAAGTVQPLPIDDSQLHALSMTTAGATVLPTTRTIPHWFGSMLDPSNGVTYGFNMVGADPNSCSGASCSVTIQVDITPIVVNID